MNPIDLTSADLLNFVIPTSLNAVGAFHGLESLVSKFTWGSSGAFVGPALILVTASFLMSHPNRHVAKALVAFIVLVSIAALGPIIRTQRPVIAPGPWLLVTPLPLIRNAMPGRFIMYAFLTSGVILSLWLTLVTRSTLERALGAGFVALLLWPNLYSELWGTPLNAPLFFRPNVVSHWLRQGETALVLPYGSRGNSMLWQAIANNYFQMAGGYTGQVPPEYQRWPAAVAFLDNTDLADGEIQLKAFLARHDVNVVIVEASEEERWLNLLSTLSIAPKKIGVLLYRLSPKRLDPYKIMMTSNLRDRFYTAQLCVLLEAASRYTDAGHSIAQLTPARAA